MNRLRMGTRVRIISEYNAYNGVTGRVVDSKTDPMSGGVTYLVEFDPGQIDESGTPIEDTLGSDYWIYEENVEALTVKPLAQTSYDYVCMTLSGNE